MITIRSTEPELPPKRASAAAPLGAMSGGGEPRESPPRPRPAAAHVNPRARADGPPADWAEQLAGVTATLEGVQAAINSGTLLDAASSNELKQQQLNLKLKAKVREQKLQKQVEELQEELEAARKSAEEGVGKDSVGAVAGLAKDFVIVHQEIQELVGEVRTMKKSVADLSGRLDENLTQLKTGTRGGSLVRKNTLAPSRPAACSA